MGETLASNKITGSQVEKWLGDYFQKPLKLKDFKATKSGDGEGYTSTILRVTLEYENGRDSYPKSIIVKTPNLQALADMVKKLSPHEDIDDEEIIAFATMNHSIECAAYKAFGKNPPIPLPIIYAATECSKNKFGVILMEDFGGKASTIGDATCAFTLQQLYAAADEVANWHAWCLTTDTNWQSHFEPVDSERRMQAFAGWTRMMRKSFESVKEKYPNVFSKLDDKMLDEVFDLSRRTLGLAKASVLYSYRRGDKEKHPTKIGSQVTNKGFALCSLLEKVKKRPTVMPEVIVHGDFYANNLMYDILVSNDDTGKIKIGSKLMCVIDWAMAHRGSAMEDFALLLAMRVDTDIRRRHTNDILRHYYTVLVKKAGIENVKASFEDVLELYNSEFVNAGLFFVLMLAWLQRLFVADTGEEGERKRNLLYERCVAVYEDFIPIMTNGDI